MSTPKFEIACPSCSHPFALDEMYTNQIKERFQKDFETKNLEIVQKQKILLEKEEALQMARSTLEDEIKKRLLAEKEVLSKQAQAKAREEYQLELKDKEQQLSDKIKKLEEAQKKELEFRQKFREVEEKEKSLDLEIQRKADLQAKTYETTIRDKFVEALRNEKQKYELEKESLTKKVDELSRKLEQGSQQTQGEILELILEDDLKVLFPFDHFQAVPKGINGADIIQTVHNNQGKACGTIIWEFKNTKNWTDSWLQKLKDDQRQLKADVAILLTSALPKEVKGFAHVDGIWVTDIQCYASLCTALRMNLLQLYLTRQANLGKNEKMETLYQYFSGHQFKQRVQTIVEAFQTMKIDLEKEKIAMQKIWAKREKELERVILGTSGMYGDLEGIIGNTLPKIEGLELDAIAEPPTLALAMEG